MYRWSREQMIDEAVAAKVASESKVNKLAAEFTFFVNDFTKNFTPQNYNLTILLVQSKTKKKNVEGFWHLLYIAISTECIGSAQLA